ncbi:MAG: hypothetical protein RBT42_07220 [Aquabacterium sp.]|jgi:hypothetical protein|uniref:hypothetical protein n=1 Tax=Aquabacterium sp. TaxID=1872578 RepID=UPI002A3657AD|nr:hypothetical protein [Aquabacterium sp.]MDX9843535.1 hypothetical protein [Aquabacterium sp.]
MSDEYQIEIPPSFTALHLDARKRLTVPLATLRARYELCEDLAQHLTEHCRGIHVEIGVDEQEVLQRCERGLCAPDSVISASEAQWVVTRLAELLGWPHPGLLPPEPSAD